MAVSKRARFEVLRRDGFECRYCHVAREYAAAHGRWFERRSDLCGPVSMPTWRLAEDAR